VQECLLGFASCLCLPPASRMNHAELYHSHLGMEAIVDMGMSLVVLGIALDVVLGL
jgi:hypothetical protein